MAAPFRPKRAAKARHSSVSTNANATSLAMNIRVRAWLIIVKAGTQLPIFNTSPTSCQPRASVSGRKSRVNSNCTSGSRSSQIASDVAHTSGSTKR